MTRKFNFIAAFLLAVTLALAAGGMAEAKNINALFTIGYNVCSCITPESEKLGKSVDYKMDVVPFIENDRAYVPVRYLAYGLGVAEKDVLWDEAAQTVTLSMEGTTVKLRVGSKTIYVNGQPQEMDVTPLMRDDRVFLPARFVAEAFGYVVDYIDHGSLVPASVSIRIPHPEEDIKQVVENRREEIQKKIRSGETVDVIGKVVSVAPDKLTVEVKLNTANFGLIDIGMTITAHVDEYTSVYVGGLEQTSDFWNRSDEKLDLTKWVELGDQVHILYNNGRLLILDRELRPGEVQKMIRDGSGIVEVKGKVVTIAPDKLTIEAEVNTTDFDSGGNDLTITAYATERTSLQIGNVSFGFGSPPDLTKWFKPGDSVEVIYKDGQALTVARGLRPGEQQPQPPIQIPLVPAQPQQP